VTVYFVYLIPVLILFFMPARPAASATV